MGNKVNNRLKELRKKHNYTLDDIEKLTGIKRGTYSNYENGKTEPKLETWSKLAHFYGVPLHYLQSAPTSKETIEATQELIINVLNDYYFKLNDDVDSLLSARLQNYVMEFINQENIKNVPIQIKNKRIDASKNISDFWLNNFAFLFDENNYSFRRAVRIVVRKDKRIVSTENIGTRSIDDLVKNIIRSISDYLVDKHESDFGYYYKHIWKSAMYFGYEDFEYNLLISENKENIEKSFKQYIDTLNFYKDSFIESLEDGTVKRLAKRREKNKEVVPILADWVNHFNFDDDFKQFIHDKGDDGYRIDINLLREYKLKNGEDITKINDYLNKFGSK